MKFYTYMLECSDGTYYVGHADDIEKRLAQHKAKTFPACYTATRLPFELVWTQTFDSRDAAFATERKIKKWSRAKKKALIKGDWDAVSHWSARRT